MTEIQDRRDLSDGTLLLRSDQLNALLLSALRLDRDAAAAGDAATTISDGALTAASTPDYRLGPSDKVTSPGQWRLWTVAEVAVGVKPVAAPCSVLLRRPLATFLLKE